MGWPGLGYMGSQNLHSQGRLLLAGFVYLGGPPPLAHALWVSSVGGGGAYSPLRSKLPTSPMLVLVSWLQATASGFVMNLNVPWIPHAERWPLCLANDAPRTLFIFKYFINFSSKMTKGPCVPRPNSLRNASHLQGCITGRTLGPEIPLFPCISLFKSPVVFFFFLIDSELALAFSTWVKNVWFPSPLGSEWSANTPRTPLEKLYLQGEREGCVNEIETPNILVSRLFS